MDAEPVRQSLLSWIFTALGFGYSALLPLAGLVCLLLTLVLVQRGKGPLAAASLILIVHVPLLIGVFAAIHGGIAAYTVIATSAVTPKPAEVAQGISVALVAPMVGLVVMIPAYATAVLGTFFRSLRPDRADQQTSND